MGQELSDRVAIVTGGAGGIGRATAELFVQEGAKVVIADLDTARGEAVAAQLGGAAAFKRADVAIADEVQALVDFAVDRFGGLHVMFNNAGIGGSFKRFLDDDLSDFDRVIAVNLRGVIVGSQRAARHMAKHGGGGNVNARRNGGIQARFGVIPYRRLAPSVTRFARLAAVGW